ncbi:pH-response regulator protein palA/rim20 [Pichia californica]|nr:pH-response regulator protein palA/rim20 [[Candida] californica]
MTSITSIDEETGLVYIIPLKTEKIDIISKLSNEIETNFYQSSKLFAKNIKLINDLRFESLNINSINKINLELITKLKKYYYIIKNLISEKFSNNTLNFNWNNINSGNWNFELENINYQIASYYTILALQEFKIDTEGIQKSGIYFQYAVGYIDLINNNNTLQLNSIKSLLFAQSQEIYLNKAKFDNMQISVLLKLSMQISDFYKDCNIENNIENNNENKIINDYYKIKNYYYKCYSFYLYSKLCEKKIKKIDQFVYLNECLKIFNELKLLDNNILYSIILQDFENLKLKIIENFELLKINNLSNLSNLPNFNQYKPLPRVKLVKSLIPKDESEFIILLNKSFNELIPLNKINEILQYQNQFKEFIENELIFPINEMNLKLKNILNDLKINFQNNDILLKLNEIPEEINLNRLKLLEIGNLNKINELIEIINKLKLNCRLKLDKIWKLLKDEIDDENSLASYYGYKIWNLGSINDDKIGCTILNTFKIYENYLNQSENNGDKLILNQIEELTPFLKIYNNEKILKDYIPESDYLNLNPEFKKNIDKINELSILINNLINERDLFLNKIKQKESNINILEIFKKNFKDENEIELSKILSNEIMKFNNEIEFILNSRLKQDELISNLNIKIQEFEIFKNKIKISNNRKESIKVLNLTYKGFFEIIGNLNQGKEFYQNLIENIEVKTIQFEEFLSKRYESKNELQRKLELNK